MYSVMHELMGSEKLHPFSCKHWGIPLLLILYGKTLKQLPVEMILPFTVEDLGVDDLYKVISRVMADNIVSKGTFLTHLEVLESQKLIEKTLSASKRSKRIILLTRSIKRHCDQIFFEELRENKP